MAVQESGFRVLIVDDVISPRMIISKMLNSMGINNVLEAGDGLEALELLKQGPFDLVISDWNMHPMDGLQLLAEIRSHQDFSNLPFVMITATAERDEVVKACTSGVTGYIIKPFNTDLLRKTVEKFLPLEPADFRAE